MKNHRRLCSALLSMLLVCAAAPEQKAKAPPINPPPAPTAKPIPDPTQPSAKMRERMAERQPDVATNAARIPAIVLKGRVIARGRAPAALVEIDGRPVTVTQGTSVVLGGVQRITFVEVSAGEVRIEINTPKETLVIN